MSRYTGIVLGGLLMGTAWANAASRDQPLTVRVLSAKTEAIPVDSDANDVPRDCNIMDYSAYCHQSRTVRVRNMMLVQDSGGKSFTISCMLDSRWSRCISLPAEEQFRAQREKGGVAIWYRNSRGKEVKQLYAVVSAPGETGAAAGSRDSSWIAEGPANAPEVSRETVKGSFTSSPSGAEITLDGRYAGNTPSIIGFSPGKHAVVLFMPGFIKWERELTVSSGSDVSVSATLQKKPQ